MRVVLLLLATRAASAWSPTFRTNSSPYEIPFTKAEQNSRDRSVASAWDGMLPQTLGDESDDVFSSPGTTFSHGVLKLPVPSTGRLDLTDHSRRRRRSRNRIDESYTTQQQSIILSHTDAGTLLMEFPATGWTAHAAIAGGFAVAWFAALVPATTTLAVVPLLLPFYLAGGMLAKSVVVEPFTSTALSIGKYGWSLSQSRYRKNALEVASGATQDIQSAIVVERRSHIATKRHGREAENCCDGTRIQYIYELQLILAPNGNIAKAMTIGKSFDNIDEPTQLANIINEQLEKVRSERKVDGTDESKAESMYLPW